MCPGAGGGGVGAQLSVPYLHQVPSMLPCFVLEQLSCQLCTAILGKFQNIPLKPVLCERGLPHSPRLCHKQQD